MSEPLINPPTAANTAPDPPWTPLSVIKGALVAINRTSGAKTVVPFQFNPIQLTRSVTPVYYQTRGDRYNATAKESLDLTITLDASYDGGPQGNGILPQLAALELLINPTSSELSTYRSTSQSSKVEILPPLAPRILFVWGPNRVLPVRITSITFTEKQFNTSLNPIFAEAALKLEVYPYSDAGDPEYNYLLSNLQKLETLNAMNSTTGMTIGVDPAGLT
jgi:hypothetical protein